MPGHGIGLVEPPRPSATIGTPFNSDGAARTLRKPSPSFPRNRSRNKKLPGQAVSYSASIFYEDVFWYGFLFRISMSELRSEGRCQHQLEKVSSPSARLPSSSLCLCPRCQGHDQCRKHLRPGATPEHNVKHCIHMFKRWRELCCNQKRFIGILRGRAVLRSLELGFEF